jgi:hypothetical protein
LQCKPPRKAEKIVCFASLHSFFECITTQIIESFMKKPFYWGLPTVEMGEKMGTGFNWQN